LLFCTSDLACKCVESNKLGDDHGIPVHLYFFGACARVELACHENWRQAIKSIGYLFWHFVVDAVYNDFFVN